MKSLFSLLLFGAFGALAHAQSPLTSFNKDQIKGSRIIREQYITYFGKTESMPNALYLVTDLSNAYIRINGQFLRLEPEDFESTEELSGRKWDTVTVAYGNEEYILKLTRIFPRKSEGAEEKHSAKLVRKSDRKLLASLPLVYIDGEIPEDDKAGPKGAVKKPEPSSLSDTFDELFEDDEQTRLSGSKKPSAASSPTTHGIRVQQPIGKEGYFWKAAGMKFWFPSGPGSSLWLNEKSRSLWVHLPGPGEVNTVHSDRDIVLQLHHMANDPEVMVRNWVANLGTKVTGKPTYFVDSNSMGSKLSIAEFETTIGNERTYQLVLCFTPAKGKLVSATYSGPATPAIATYRNEIVKSIKHSFHQHVHAFDAMFGRSAAPVIPGFYPSPRSAAR